MKILIIKLGALGDIVMSTPLIQAIQTTFSGAQVTLLTTPTFGPLFEHWEALNVVTHPRHGVRNGLRSLAWIRAQRFDTIFDLQGTNRSAILCALSGANRRIGNHTRYPYTHHPLEPWHGQCHIFERMREVLQAGGVEELKAQAYLPSVDAERAQVARFRAEHNLSANKYVLLHAGASATRPEKRWPYFDALAKIILAHDLQALWIGAQAEQELNARLCEIAGGIDATGRFSLCALAELGRGARFAVTNDSGPMHVLSAAGIPVFGLFGPSDWRRNHAIGQAHNVIACVECCAEFAGQKSAACLDRITPSVVWERIKVARLA